MWVNVAIHRNYEKRASATALHVTFVLVKSGDTFNAFKTGLKNKHYNGYPKSN